METFTIQVAKEYGLSGHARLDGFTFGRFQDIDCDERHPAILVAPGGAYHFVSRREGEPIAAYFMGKGYNAFILTYTAQHDAETEGLPASYPQQILELSASVDYLHRHADALHIDPTRIYLVGFSAGGHLVGNFATDHENINRRFGRDWALSVAAVGLAYPVISRECGHVDSFDNLLKDIDEAERPSLLSYLNLDRAVTASTLPSFVWTTFGDTCVPPINSVRYVEQCLAHHVRCELHLFPDGQHGASTCDTLTNNAQPFLEKNHAWLPLCHSFFATCHSAGEDAQG